MVCSEYYASLTELAVSMALHTLENGRGCKSDAKYTPPRPR